MGSVSCRDHDNNEDLGRDAGESPSLEGHSGVKSVALSKDGQRVVSGFDDKP